MTVRHFECAIEQIEYWHPPMFVQPHIAAFVSVANQYKEAGHGQEEGKARLATRDTGGVPLESVGNAACGFALADDKEYFRVLSASAKPQAAFHGSVMTLIWWIVVVAGLGAFVAVLLTVSWLAIPTAIVVVSLWIVLGIFHSWYFGLRRHVLAHLHINDVAKAHVITHDIRTFEKVNVQLALDHLRQSRALPKPIYGVSKHLGSITEVATNNPFPVPLEWKPFPRSLTETCDCASNALYFLMVDDKSFCVLVRPFAPLGQAVFDDDLPTASAPTGNARSVLDILAAHQETAQEALKRILDVAQEKSVYRGSILSLEKPKEKGGGFAIKFHDLPPANREAIILPEEVLQVVERNVLGLLAHGDVLRRAGQSTRHGVLLHGPPGTGKTLVTRYLARACINYTVILLTGRELRFIRESCRLAQLLAPSLLVMEDVDLVASDRRRNRNKTVLHELMDEMDGLGPRADCIFLLTSNRPAVLEKALAVRPGRVDQAIYFPLPDLECRRRLFALFSKGLDLRDVDMEPLLERIAGASPAFIQELFRKAALLAAERGEQSQPLKITASDLDNALRELLVFGGKLTRNLLGFQDKTE